MRRNYSIEIPDNFKSVTIFNNKFRVLVEVSEQDHDEANGTAKDQPSLDHQLKDGEVRGKGSPPSPSNSEDDKARRTRLRDKFR